MRRQGKAVSRIEDLAGLGKTDPAMAMWMTIFMFSMAGIPPLAGFFAKLYVFMAAIEAKLEKPRLKNTDLRRNCSPYTVVVGEVAGTLNPPNTTRG
jgi:NADH:ubiquinone oxidoreductase subunit 5 (subunit L)/multisubunit Na+/H+ antiporter MnhA subunit